MNEEGKKVSFGFSKFVKKTQIVPSQLHKANKDKEVKIDLIDCFDGNTMKLKDPVETKDQVLVIPLKRRQEAIITDNQQLLRNRPSVVSPDFSLKDRPVINKCQTDEISEVNSPTSFSTSSNVAGSSSDKLSGESSKCKTLSLDEVAAKEILEDLKSKKSEEENSTGIYSVPLTNNPPSGEKESTLEDYENIPVSNFGMAMLRGMGWTPGKGVGKNEKVVSPAIPTLRPKGMGLGADKVLKTNIDSTVTSQDLKLVKGSFIRVIAGQHKDSYGQVEGFDDEGGRIIVKLALKNSVVTLNEFMVSLVDKNEFVKNSKVINVSKYEQYKYCENKKSLNSDIVKYEKEGIHMQGSYEKQDKTYEQFSDKSGKSSRHSNSSKTYVLPEVKNEEVTLLKESPRDSKSKIKGSKCKRRSSASSEDSEEQRQSSSSSILHYTSSKDEQSSHRNDHSSRKVSKYRTSSRSSSSDRSIGPRHHLQKDNYYVKKKSMTDKYRPKSRSRSPRRYSASKKHKKSKSRYS